MNIPDLARNRVASFPRIYNRFFGADERGNVAMIFALSILPIMVMAGGAVDFSRASTAKQSL